MNESEYLIYHYSSKNKKWYDATNSIAWFSKKNNAWQVKFKSSDKFYYVSYQNMKVFDKPIEIEFLELFYKGSQCFNVKKLLLFNNQIFKIFYVSGQTKLAFPNEIKITYDLLKNNEKANAILNYYKRVVKEIAKDEEDQFLISQFDEINCVNSDSVLSLYLKGELAKNNERISLPIICPFGLNMSQSKAMKMAFSNRISIIEGPPGTGKTQTILNIISNAVINGKSVAVVSNNNSATDNIFQKLEKYGYSFICAPLGNAENVDNFFEDYDSTIPTIKTNKVEVSKLNDLYLNIPSYFEKENQKKKNIALLEAIEIEYKHFLIDNQNVDFNEYKFKNINVSPTLVQEGIVRLKEKEKLSFFDKLFLRFKLKLKKDFFKSNNDTGIILLQNLYYLSKKNHLKKQIAEIDKYMKGQSLDKKLELYKTLSNDYLSNKLAELYNGRKRNQYNKVNYKIQFSNFIKDYPVILSSTYALVKCSEKGYLFDYLIVDESSQVNMASAILSMGIAKNIIVVGDIKQLPQIDDSSFKKQNEELLKEFNIPKEYSYYGNSIMSSMLSLYGKKNS